MEAGRTSTEAKKVKPLRPGAAAALEFARSAGRPVRHREFLDIGIHREDVARLEFLGRIRRVARGTYVVDEGVRAVRRRWDFLAAAALRWPLAVICGPTAAAYHGLVRDDPASIWIAVPRGRGRPRGSAAGRAIRVREWNESRFLGGVVEITIDGVRVRIMDARHARAEMAELGMACTRRKAN
jgi:predicted transcriptional regulator of viral defense system